jgi:hypothetical protein
MGLDYDIAKMRLQLERLIASFTEPSLASLLADFKRRTRDTIEAERRSSSRRV